MNDDINPEKYAGEGWYATEEYARPKDIDNKYTRAEVMREGEYYPTPGNEEEALRRLKKRY